jgi:hypothetical protein
MEQTDNLNTILTKAGQPGARAVDLRVGDGCVNPCSTFS